VNIAERRSMAQWQAGHRAPAPACPNAAASSLAGLSPFVAIAAALPEKDASQMLLNRMRQIQEILGTIGG